MANFLDSIGAWAKANPQALQAFGSTASAIGGGMVGHGNDQRDMFRAVSKAMTQDQMNQKSYLTEAEQARATQAQLAAEQEKQNETIQWLQQQGYDDLVSAVGGGFDIGEAWKIGLERANPQAAGGDETFFGNVVPMMQGDDIVYGQVSNRGRWQPLQGAEGLSPAPTTRQVDIGNYVVTQDIHGNELFRTPKSGDVPTGFQPAPSGGLAPMAGGPQAAEMQAAQVKAGTALNTLEQKNAIAVNAIDTALSQAGPMTTGNVMGNSGWVPMLGQGALDLGKTLDTIKANIGFEELQTMRDNSPTGGALGQVTERELAFLQSTIANIEQSQSEDQLKRNLQILRDFIAQSQERRRAAYAQQFGGVQPTQLPPQGGSGGWTVLGVE